MQVEMVDPEGTILRELNDPAVKRNDVALTYAYAIRQRSSIDWAKVNGRIIDRWSLSALEYIKKRAWDLVMGRIEP